MFLVLVSSISHYLSTAKERIDRFELSNVNTAALTASFLILKLSSNVT
jgi:hypothetical protein